MTGTGSGRRPSRSFNAYDNPRCGQTLSNGQPNPAFSTSDLAKFDQQFGLPAPPSFIKYNETGQTTNLPGTDPAGAGNPLGDWETEEALNIEWAHAIAPGASIDLIEASTNLFNAVKTAGISPACRWCR